ncbi:hypothetical protein PHET_00179 [Paragonimus heterotremus]|uniref:Uncharacterized protein n=1 Tax=Paragonimus heterotremus TaxID=100268 RepID=A0A8J4TSS0_9TREM|nr:hypothetical protein PHET_00179 [Paragonimus heterotremus]
MADTIEIAPTAGIPTTALMEGAVARRCMLGSCFDLGIGILRLFNPRRLRRTWLSASNNHHKGYSSVSISGNVENASSRDVGGLCSGMS